MKAKCYLAAAIVSLLWVGCSQEEVGNETKGGANVIYATIEGASRSTVTDAGVFSWAAGDEISLVGQTADGTVRDTYTYSEGNAFTPPTSPAVTAPVVAYYPANDNHNTTTFCLPGSYGDTNTGYVANTHAAMMATPPASGNTYAFMHLGGVMRFDVKSVPAGVNEFRLMIPGKKINGHFAITANSNGEKVIATKDVTAETSTEYYVQILFKASDEARNMTFYVPMPTGTYGDYTVSLNNNGSYIDCASTGVTNTINRRTLLLMPTFTYDGTNLVKGDAIDQVIQLSDGNQSASLTDNAEVIVAPGTDADAVATLAYTPASDGSSTLVISDGSADGTTSGDSEGKVVVETASNSTVASCDIDAPTLSVTLSAADNGTATYTEVTANTAEQTLIIGKGVTIENLVVNGGNVVLKGNVKNISSTATTAITISLEEDVTLPNALTVGGGNFILDLGGYALATAQTLSEGSYSAAILVSGGDLTIKNGTIQTSGASEHTKMGALWVYGSNSANVTIEDGAILKGNNWNETSRSTGCTATVYVNNPNGYVTINGGEFYCVQEAQVEGQNQILNYKNSFTTKNIVVKGGKFHGMNPAKGNGTEVSYLGTNTMVAEDGGVYTVTSIPETGSEITLTDDVTIYKALNFSSGTYTLNLGGYTLTTAQTLSEGSYSAAILVSGGDLTIKNGTIQTSGASEHTKMGALWVYGSNSANVTIEDGAILKGNNWNETSRSTGCTATVYVNNPNGYVTINGGEFYCVQEAQEEGQNQILNYKNSFTTQNIVVNGGKFYGMNPAMGNGAEVSYLAGGYTPQESEENGVKVYTVVQTN